MAASGDRINVTSASPVLLADAVGHDSISGVTTTLRMVDAGPVYLGDQNVTAATGFEWDKTAIGATMEAADLGGDDAIYGITASGTTRVDRLRTGI